MENKIQTEIAFKRFEDDMTIIYSAQDGEILACDNLQGDSKALITRCAVDKFQDFFTPEFESGSNQVWLKHEPDSFKGICIPTKDILYIREVDYKYIDEV